MFDNYPNYDSIHSDREREEKLMQDKKDRCHKRGKLYFVLFWLSAFGTPAIFLIMVLGSTIAVLLDSMGFAYLVAGLLGLIGIVIGVVTAVILFVLGKEESCFRAAGIAYLFVAGLNTASQFPPEGIIKTVVELGTIIATLFYLFEFINGSIYILAGVDDYIANSWEIIKKVFIYLFAGLVVCIILMFIPIFTFFAVILLIIAVIIALGVYIWELVLMFKTASALKNF